MDSTRIAHPRAQLYVHADLSLMTYVMGPEPPKTPDRHGFERVEMARLLDDGMDAGLCGFLFSVSCNLGACRFDVYPMVNRHMCTSLSTSHRCCVSVTKVHGVTLRPPAPRARPGFRSGLADEARRPILFRRSRPLVISRFIAHAARGLSAPRQGPFRFLSGCYGCARVCLLSGGWESVTYVARMARAATVTKEEKLVQD